MLSLVCEVLFALIAERGQEGILFCKMICTEHKFLSNYLYFSTKEISFDKKKKKLCYLKTGHFKILVRFSRIQELSCTFFPAVSLMQKIGNSVLKW